MIFLTFVLDGEIEKGGESYFNLKSCVFSL